MLAIEGLSQDVAGLVKSAEHESVKSHATALFDGGTDSDFQVLCQIDQVLNVALVGSRLDNNGNDKPGEELFLVL